MPPADSPPNAVFIDDPAVVSDKRLDSPQFSFFESGPARLTFRHNFNFEASDTDPDLGFDGGVLELSTDGGNTFQDILAAGGSFFMGGYNRTISADRGSPIAGRRAWSGNSEGFVTTVVDVPAVQTLSRLRWRMASDTGGSNEGWRVDNVNQTWCQGHGTPCATATATQCTPTATPTYAYYTNTNGHATALLRLLQRLHSDAITPTATPTATALDQRLLRGQRDSEATSYTAAAPLRRSWRGDSGERPPRRPGFGVPPKRTFAGVSRLA